MFDTQKGSRGNRLPFLHAYRQREILISCRDFRQFDGSFQFSVKSLLSLKREFGQARDRHFHNGLSSQTDESFLSIRQRKAPDPFHRFFRTIPISKSGQTEIALPVSAKPRSGRSHHLCPMQKQIEKGPGIQSIRAG